MKLDNGMIGWVDLSNEIYHQVSTHLGASTIKEMRKSPKHFKCAIDGLKEYSNQTLSRFDLGTCFHSVVLEQSTSGFIKGPDVSSKATKEWKAAKEIAEGDKKILLTPDEYERVVCGFESFCEHPMAHKLVSQCQRIEQSGFFRDEESGLWCKIRPDGYSQDDVRGDFIFDYKTATSLKEKDLANAVFNYGYHISAAHYIEGVKAIEGRNVSHYYLCFQEVSAPYDTVVMLLDPDAITYGKQVRSSLLLKIADCMDKNDWPGISDKVGGISLPTWAWDVEAGLITGDGAA